MDIATAVRFVEDLPFLQVVKSEGVLTPLGAALIVVGLLSLVPVVIGLVVSALASLVSLVSSGPDVRKYGEWAIVTGATDGIGEQLAIELAARGVKVCIVGRSAEKLDATATKIKDKRPAAEVRTIRADFSDTEGGKLYTRIEAELHDILPSVGILFNNVGVSYPSALYFEEFCNPDLAKSTTAPEDMIAVNVTSAVKMTGLVLPHMKKRHKGAIVFVSSAHGRIPAGAPLYAEYGACKNFVQSFARTLAVECEGSGVSVQVQFPYFVATKMAKIRTASLFTPSASTFAKSMLASLGSGVAVVPYWAHRIQDSLIFLLPEFIVKSNILSMHKGIRSKYLKKLTEEKKDS